MVHREVPIILMTERNLTLSNLQYHLPRELIAQKPLPEREASRLLVSDVSSGELQDRKFNELPELLLPGDLLVLNDTRVFRARLNGRKAETGGRVEVFLLKDMGDGRWKALIRPGKAAGKGRRFLFENGLSCQVVSSISRGRGIVRFTSDSDTISILRRTARVPLPPYIKREPEELDDHRYQTVYAATTGAVAAPTAGLHFTDGIIEALRDKGVNHTFVTLHVGPGTFQPLRHERLEDNRLEPEEYLISADSLERIRETRNRGGRIVAVGTTSTRILETVDIMSPGPLSGETEIFIFPPYGFRNVDVLITNFHLPGSSLLCLVAAFMGYDFMMEAYRHAVQHSYRFYSYGDAMMISGRPGRSDK
jgi:S-adenosylmethionine:tRNA ribosyltransferase-isomerase